MRAVNLIPAGQRSGSTVGAGHSEGGAYAVLAVCAGLAALALLYGMARRDISSRRTKVATVTAQAAQAQAAAGALAPYTNFVSLREQRTQAVAALVGSRFDWAHAIHELGRVLTAQTSISSLTGTIAAATVAGAPGAAASSAAPASAAPASASPATTPASATGTTAATTAGTSATVTSATPPGSVPTFTLVGCATTQPAVAKMLGRLRLIDGVSEVALQSSTKSASSGGAAAGSTCPGGDPAFTVLVTFDALPVAPAATASTSTVSNSPGGSAAAAAATSSGVGK
jgi:hypothetical protein